MRIATGLFLALLAQGCAAESEDVIDLSNAAQAVDGREGVHLLLSTERPTQRFRVACATWFGCDVSLTARIADPAVLSGLQRWLTETHTAEGSTLTVRVRRSDGFEQFFNDALRVEGSTFIADHTFELRDQPNQAEYEIALYRQPTAGLPLPLEGVEYLVAAMWP